MVQCYGEHTALPFAVQHRDYFVYNQDAAPSAEIAAPAEDRMLEASRLVAAAVFVTDPGGLSASAELGLDPERTIALPRAVDSNRLLRFARDIRSPRPGRVVRFVTTSPHDWLGSKPGHTNGNDKVLQALALVRASGRTCGLVTTARGKDVETSKILASQLGVADMIEWKPVMPRPRLWREYLEGDAVIDRFGAGSFSDAALDAMLLGRRVISQVDAAQAGLFFGAAPPIYGCKTPEDIARAMIRVIDDPADLAMDGAKNQAWATRYHSSERILALQVDAYRKLGGLDIPAGGPENDAATGLLQRLARGPLRPLRPIAAPVYRFVLLLPSSNADASPHHRRGAHSLEKQCRGDRRAFAATRLSDLAWSFHRGR